MLEKMRSGLDRDLPALREATKVDWRERAPLFNLTEADQTFETLAFDLWTNHTEFRSVLMESALGSIAAQLLGEETSIRVLKDAFFESSPATKGCGWHVDDPFFWPANPESGGLNVWVAMSQYNAAEGGGLLVAPGTHRHSPASAGLTHLQATISPHSLPLRPGPHDWPSEAREVIKPNTCDLETLSPELWEKFEAVRKTWDMQPGDALICDRWLFHRSFRSVDGDGSGPATPKMRYTVRLISSDARSNGQPNQFVTCCLIPSLNSDLSSLLFSWNLRLDACQCCQGGALSFSPIPSDLAHFNSQGAQTHQAAETNWLWGGRGLALGDRIGQGKSCNTRLQGKQWQRTRNMMEKENAVKLKTPPAIPTSSTKGCLS
ncbi:unnamed protein product [Chrysoparadoxa australica]